MACVDACFATDRRIHLRKQGSRYLHKPHTAPHCACCKPGQVTNHTAAQRNHRIVAFNTRLENQVANSHVMFETFGLLTGRQGQRNRLDAIGLQTVHHHIKIKRGNMLIGYNSSATTFETRGCFPASLGHQAWPDENVISATRQRHMHALLLR
ncbi:hypothetical protein D3C80_1404330 [compost metagenome]